MPTYTVEQCKSKLFRLGLKYGIAPALISTRLLSADDKHDMLSGLIPDELLDTAVKLWLQNGMPDYTNGTRELYRPKYDVPVTIE